MKGDRLTIPEGGYELKCNHWLSRKSRWWEYGINLIVCDSCLKKIFHILNRTEYWAKIDAADQQKVSDEENT